MAKLIIVSNRLPVVIQCKNEKISVHPSAGGLATGLGSIYKSKNNLWIGWPGTYTSKEEEKREITEHLSKENMAPVFLSKKDVKNYYEGFSNTTLWPLFHHFPKYTFYEDEYWESYKYVNEHFCNEILKYAQSDDTIWIHDYQLMLLPALLRKALPGAKIAYFQHIPFPAFEIFRILPWRNEVLEGLLGSDLIGFHTYDDVKYFLGSLNRLKGIENIMGEIRHNGRTCSVDSFPMGIDYKKFEEAAESKETYNIVQKYKHSFGSMKFILSIDRLDYSKGIIERLQGYELFLRKYPEYKGKVGLIMIVVPSRENVPLYLKLKVKIDELVGRINAEFRILNWTPVLYFYRSFDFNSLSAFYKFSDVALITPLRDGMNLVCKEYVASRTDKTGVLILSEMAGAAKELSDAIIINPNNKNEIVEALHRAIEMPKEEQVRRNEELQYILRRYDIHNWVKLYLKRLDYVSKKQEEFSLRLLNAQIQKSIAIHYARSRKRVIFLDYDGTLVPIKNKPSDAYPDKGLFNLINELLEEEKNKIVLVSGRDKNVMQEWFGHLNIDMVAEHGVYIKQGAKDWQLSDTFSGQWKEQIRSILELFVDRAPGSFIEEKDYSLVWHYRKCDLELGELRSRELLDHLNYLTAHIPVKVFSGKRTIEIKNANISKGAAVQNWLEEDIDFMLAAGDDWTDEEMFAPLPEQAYTIKIGFSHSSAKYHIQGCDDNSCNEFRSFLRLLVKTDKEENKNAVDHALTSISIMDQSLQSKLQELLVICNARKNWYHKIFILNDRQDKTDWLKQCMEESNLFTNGLSYFLDSLNEENIFTITDSAVWERLKKLSTISNLDREKMISYSIFLEELAVKYYRDALRDFELPIPIEGILERHLKSFEGALFLLKEKDISLTLI